MTRPDPRTETPPSRRGARTAKRSSRSFNLAPTIVWLILLGLVAGCVSSGAGGWTKPGATEEQVNHDSADCLFGAKKIVPSREGPRTIVDQDRYRQCMANRGYTSR
jgi:hypothetical protein